MLKYWLWLTGLEGLDHQTRLALLRRFGSPEDIYYADTAELLLTEGLTCEQGHRWRIRAWTRRSAFWPSAARWTCASSPFRTRNIPAA